MAGQHDVIPAETTCFASEEWCTTEVKVLRFSYSWTIHSFSSYHVHRDAKLESLTFPKQTNANQKWCVSLYPQGAGDDCKEYISLFLVKRHHADVGAKFKFAVINAKQEKKLVQEIRNVNRFTENENDFGWKRFVKRSIVLDIDNELLPNDTLTIYCEVSVYTDAVRMSGQVGPVMPTFHNCILSEDMEQLFESEKFSDVTISVSGRDIQAHKNILAARSPVFAAMFEHDMREKKNSRVCIEDIDYHVMHALLRFMYTGKVQNLEEIARNLLAAADKYAIEGLKETCGKAILATLSKENATEVLILADQHNASELKAHAINIIRRYATRLMDSVGWKIMFCSHPHLALEVVRSLVPLPADQLTASGDLQAEISS